MRTIRDYSGRIVRLTEERFAHIREHPEMEGLEDAIDTAVENPLTVIRSRSDSDVELYYDYVYTMYFDDKYLCVVVKTVAEDSFVITAYLTDKVKKGDVIWERNS